MKQETTTTATLVGVFLWGPLIVAAFAAATRFGWVLAGRVLGL